MLILSIYPFHGRRSNRPDRLRLLGAALLAVAGAAVLPAPAASFTPNTLRVGSLEIHPSFLTELTYNDNISLTQEKVSDVIFRQIPALTLEWGRAHTPIQVPRLANPHGMPIGLLLDVYLLRFSQMGERDYMGRGKPELPVGQPAESAALSSMRLRKYGFFLKYEPMFIHLLDNPRFDSVEQDLFFAGDLRLPSGLYLRADNHFRTSSSIDNFRYEVADFNRSLRAQGVGYAVNQAAFTLGYNFFADYLAYATYSNYFSFLEDFDFSQLIADAGLPDFVQLGIEGIDSDRLGFGIHSVGAFVLKPIDRRTLLTVGYLVASVRGNLDEFSLTGSFFGDVAPFELRVDSDPRNAVWHEAQVRFQRVLTVKKYVFGVPVPKTTLEGAFSYQMRRFEGAQIRIEAFGSPVETLPVQLEDFNEFFAELQLNSEIRPRTNVFLEFSRYPREEIGGSGNVSINYGVAASVTHRVGTKWSMGARGAFRFRESPFEGALEQESYEYRAGANVLYNFQSWLQAAMIYQFIARQGDIGYNDFDSQRIRLQILAAF
jgi:hypothetical protein